VIRICLLLLLCVVSLRASAEISTDTINNTDLSGAYALRTPSGSPKVFMRDALGTAISITASPYGASATLADNQGAIQSAINAAVAAGVPLRIPAASTCYKYTAPLTISGNLTIVGDNVTENWGGGINVPLGSPQLAGSVLCPASNGSDAIDITGSSKEVNIFNVGILFQTPLSGTGDCINYVPAQNVQGLSGSRWENVKCYGHDGNHYAWNLTNFIYDTFDHVFAYGGGVALLQGNSTGGNYGNSVFDHLYGQTIVGGTSDGLHISANTTQRLNLLTFIRPQVITDNVSGVSLSNPPTSAQYIAFGDDFIKNVRMIGTDFETNVSSPIQLPKTVFGNDWDWSSMFTTAATIGASSWGANGLFQGPVTHTVQDVTSSGTVANETLYAYPGWTMTAANATTYSFLSTLYLGKPTVSTNVTASRNLSLYTDGAIYVNNTATMLGMFDTGNTQINKTAGTATTEIGNGTTSGTVSIGGASNIVNITAGTLQANGTAGVTCSGTPTSSFATVNGIVTHC